MSVRQRDGYSRSIQDLPMHTIYYEHIRLATGYSLSTAASCSVAACSVVPCSAEEGRKKEKEKQRHFFLGPREIVRARKKQFK